MPHRYPNGLPSILPATVARIERRLPAPGEIMVGVGSRVEPDDLIGRCRVQHEPVLLDVAGTLGVEPREVRRRMRRKPGDHIAFRDLLARRRGRSVLAPFTGALTAVDEATGFIVLTPDPVPASVPAAIRGYIAGIQPNRSATIATAAAIVQGASGFGSEQWGALRLVATGPDAVLTPEMIDAGSAFKIIIGGREITAAALRKARKEQVKGVIVGSVTASELRDFWGPRFDGNWLELLRTGMLAPTAEDDPAVLITEGFGSYPMSRPTWELLRRLDGQQAYLDVTTRIVPPEQRPRLVIPLARLPGGNIDPAPALDLRPGAVVRLLDPAHLGQIGRVESHGAHRRLPSGVRAPAATVQIGEAERVVVPEFALEVIQ